MNINIDEFMKVYNRINIIDIRSSELYSDGHIPNSVNINPYDLVNNPGQYLDIYKKYYIYCESGQGSLKVCQILNQKGYDVVNLVGGFNSWLKWDFK